MITSKILPRSMQADRPEYRDITVELTDAEIRKAVGRVPERDAVMQANCSAIALEGDRRSSRMLEIDQALSRLDFDRRRIERTIKTLNEERAMLEVSTHG